MDYYPVAVASAQERGAPVPSREEFDRYDELDRVTALASDGSVIATIALVVNPAGGKEFGRLYVAPEYRRLGLARLFMVLMDQRHPDPDIIRTSHSTSPLRSVYAELGWVESGEPTWDRAEGYIVWKRQVQGL